ncbi:MAG: fused MFS/spermidine synthase [Candidatus Riflebacteria bacterium]|nr:fused MFS/spermidine synthase [Candidatus Riflebacteria bacterium]
MRDTLFAGTIFVCSFLLFLIQPLAGKALLPVFGGSAAVWSACLLFFQVLLLVGYAWSHLLQRLSRRWQPVLQGALALAALLWRNPRDLAWSLTGPATVPALTGPDLPDRPVLAILLRLSVTIGLPYLVLSTTSPLLQAWLSQGGGRFPYRLYALSNIASLGSLLVFPVLLEPRFGLASLLGIWADGHLLATLLLLGCAALSWRAAGQAPPPLPPPVLETAAGDSAGPHPPLTGGGSGWRTTTLWFLGSTAGSLLLLAFTNHICRDLASIPFLWVLPLALYLLTFVLVFAEPPWYRPDATALGVLLLGAAQSLPWLGGERAYASLAVPLNLATFFVMAWFLHGEVSRRRPPAAGLTGFYLVLSVGGAVGGALVNFAAPVVFSDYWELPLAEAATALAALRVLWADPHSGWRPRSGGRAALLPFSLATVILVFALVPPFLPYGELWMRTRNFYGVIRVNATADRVILVDGRVQHGNRPRDPGRSQGPTAYFGPGSAIDSVLQALAPRGPLHVGLVGLGVGTIAAYARSGDRFTFFELNPAVVEAAQRFFFYLASAPATIDIQVGDGRKRLEALPDQQFDLLVLDAFSSDSIPTHLLTVEAFRLYRRHLRPDGVLVVHISNSHLDLAPLMTGLAAAEGWRLTLTDSPALADLCMRSCYAVFQSPGHLLALPRHERATFQEVDPLASGSRRLLWTDDASDMLSLLR